MLPTKGFKEFAQNAENLSRLWENTAIGQTEAWDFFNASARLSITRNFRLRNITYFCHQSGARVPFPVGLNLFRPLCVLTNLIDCGLQKITYIFCCFCSSVTDGIQDAGNISFQLFWSCSFQIVLHFGSLSTY